ncbi:MAG: peptidase C15 [Limnothrix sp. RL_2_0]|nr:peptidase C15 [Limnothrix sp. RL_2_0]
MNRPTLLLTSFRPWLKHHRSNASDDLLEIIQGRDFIAGEVVFLRQLPVDIQAASGQVIKAIATHQPNFVVCCGMAESRDRLTIESQAFSQADHYETTVNLQMLSEKLNFTDISHDAGKFVCEGLYFQVLQYLHLQKLAVKTPAIFVHVPILTAKNTAPIVQDFIQILHTMSDN